MISAIIDIGSGGVGLALILLEKNKVPIIKYSARRELPRDIANDPQKLLSSSAVTLSYLMDKMPNGVSYRPSKVFCFLSSHLIASQPKIISVHFDKPTRMTAVMIKDIVDKEIGGSGVNTVVEQKIMKIKLNGYEVTRFKDKVASQAEMSIFYTVSSADILQKLRASISGSIHTEPLEFHSFPMAFFSVLRDLYRSDSDFIFADIGSEITDIGLVKDGVIINSTSFPLGKNSIVRAAANMTKHDPAMLESMFHNYAEGSLERDSMRQFGEVANSSSEGWRDAMTSILKQFGQSDILPRKIFILADKDFLGIFQNIISPPKSTSEVIPLTSANLVKFCDNKSTSSSDPFLMIAAIFVNKLFN